MLNEETMYSKNVDNVMFYIPRFDNRWHRWYAFCPLANDKAAGLLTAGWLV